jgi:protein TonB
MSRRFRRLGLALAAAAAVSTLSAAASADEKPGYTPPRADGPQQMKVPPAAQLDGRERTIYIQVYVSSNGKVQNARLVRSSGVDRLDNWALESVLAWRFKPAEENGRTTSGWANVQVTYKVPTD